MVQVRGIGWVTEREYGGIIRAGVSRFRQPGALEELGPAGVFQHPFRNLGRLDRVSKMSAAAVGLALRDAGMSSGPDTKRDVGIIGTNARGSLSADLQYFEDYVRCGRTLARGNLFIYTLPSSPLGEAAIHFGLVGPLFYLAGGAAPFGTALREAEEIIGAEESAAMLAGTADEREAFFAMLTADEAEGLQSGVPVQVLRTIAEQGLPVPAMVRAFQAVKGRT